MPPLQQMLPLQPVQQQVVQPPGLQAPHWRPQATEQQRVGKALAAGQSQSAATVFSSAKGEQVTPPCIDVEPPTEEDWAFPTCASQLANGKCNERKASADGLCELTCGICKPAVAAQSKEQARDQLARNAAAGAC